MNKHLGLFGDLLGEFYDTMNNFVKTCMECSHKIYVDSTDDEIKVTCVLPSLCDADDAAQRESLNRTAACVLSELSVVARDVAAGKTYTVKFTSGDNDVTFTWDESLGAFVVVFKGTKYAFDVDAKEVDDMLVEVCQLDCNEAPVDDYRGDVEVIDLHETEGIGGEDEFVVVDDDPDPEDEAGKPADNEPTYAEKLKASLEAKSRNDHVAEYLATYIINQIEREHFFYAGECVDVDWRNGIMPTDIFNDIIAGRVNLELVNDILINDYGFSKVRYNISFPEAGSRVRLFF